MKEKLKTILNHYGCNNQQRKLQEKVFELQEAITKYENTELTIMLNGEEHLINKNVLDTLRNHIVEEMADVMVLLNQFKLLYGIKDNEILNVANYKIERQIRRINNNE